MARVMQFIRSWRGTTVIVLLALAIGGILYARAWLRPSPEILAAIPTWDELTGEIPADRDNAAVVYSRAFSLITMPEPQSQVVPRVAAQGRAPDAEQLAQLRARLPGHEEALALIHEAAQRPACAFSLVPRDTLVGDFPHLHGVEDVLLLEVARAIVLGYDGNTAEAFAGLADAVDCARNGFSGMPALKSFLMETRAVEMVCSATRIVLNGGQVSADDSRPLADALQRIDLDADLILALRAEGAWGRAIFASAAGRDAGRPGSVLRHGAPGWPHYIPGLFLSANRRIYLDEMAGVVGEVAQPYRTATNLDAPEVPDWARLARTMLPAPRVPMLSRDEAIAWQRMCLAALQIAAREDAPESLEALAPDDDTQLRDVFSGEPLRYARTGAGYRLYSVGRDLDDDGGAPQANVASATRREGDIVWSTG